MKEIESIEEFDNLLQSAAALDKILVVDFFAKWCGPCKRASPLYEKLSQRYHYKDVHFVKVNVDESSDLTAREGVSSLPTFKVYKEGRCINEFYGANLGPLEQAIDVAYMDESVKEIVSNSSSPLTKKARSKLMTIASIAASKVINGNSFELKLSDPIFEKYFLVVPGCMQFLFSMGFQEKTESLFLPADASRRQINKLIRQLRGPPPPKIAPSTNALLGKLESIRQQVALFSKREYQKLARKAVPIENLVQEAAMASSTAPANVTPYPLLRALLRWFKEDFFAWAGDRVCTQCGAQLRTSYIAPNEAEAGPDCLATSVELYTCPTAESHPVVRFPRFNNPAKLLETREGRCGEWAACFAFILSALRRKTEGRKGKEKAPKEGSASEPWFPGVRYVYDVTDHVFCEVWLKDLEDPDPERAESNRANGGGRWVHVDPCEGIVDVPLVYEQGWKKKLSYIFAFTVPPSDARPEAVDVADVVWKYSTDFKAVCKRRKSVPEVQLARYLAQVHEEAQQALPEGKTAYNRRLFNMTSIVQELAVMMRPPRPSLESFQGRQSGTEAWRRSRGEFSVFQTAWEGSGTTIKPTEAELKQRCLYLRYNCARDVYARPFHKVVHGQEEEEEDDDDASVASTAKKPAKKTTAESQKYLSEVYKEGWASMASRWRNIARKVEKDWKTVYLARKEGCHSYDEGVMEWRVDLHGLDYSVAQVTLFATLAVFDERSRALLEVSGDDGRVTRGISVGSPPLMQCEDFAGAKEITLSARLFNEVESPQDSAVYQKAQIFRQKETDLDSWPFELKITLRKDSSKSKEKEKK